MAARPKPFNVEALLSSVVAALQIKGDSRAIAAVVEGEAELLLWDHDFGVNYWRLNLGIPIQLYYALSDAERESAEESILEVARHFFGSLAEDALNRVVLSPQVRDVTEDWRGEALKFIKGEGVTKQQGSSPGSAGVAVAV
ncbi:MAG: hypothetical protein IPK27_19930 [Rhodanobacteraceae bacterium]|nr:hypothetical protein [Rhodanobacteraceae bacterium]